MSRGALAERVTAPSPRVKSRIAGVFYLLTFVTGGVALFVPGRVGFAAGLVAAACYIAVTLLFYDLFKPVSRNLSLLAAVLSLVGCAVGPLSLFRLVPPQINSLVFFGFYCLLIGLLIFRSTFVPRILGVLMAFAGVGWLTFLSPPLANSLSPYVFFPGILGEGALTMWLLAVGVNVQEWKRQTSGAANWAAAS
jgi:Domain of unknown function (DUF4386)